MVAGCGAASTYPAQGSSEEETDTRSQADDTPVSIDTTTDSSAADAYLSDTIEPWCTSDALVDDCSTSPDTPADANPRDSDMASDGPNPPMDDVFDGDGLEEGDGAECMPAPEPQGTHLQAIVNWRNGKAYAYREAEYIRYDLTRDEADVDYPRSIEAWWPGVWTDGVDAATTLDANTALYTRNGALIRYDMAANQAMPGYPTALGGVWPALWPDGLDAMTRVGTELYAFRDGVLRVLDLERNTLLREHPMTEAFPGLSVEDAHALDAAMSVDDRHLYLFHGATYTGIDLTGGVVQPALSRGVAWDWPGLWDPYDGTGEFGDRLPSELQPLLFGRPSEAEIEARRQRVAASLNASETWMSDRYPLYLASLESRLQTYGCGIIRRDTGAWRFRCATDTSGALSIPFDDQPL
ncbi:MAG: hemopexin repeat-containing protein, partial [Myxococcota bacterium]